MKELDEIQKLRLSLILEFITEFYEEKMVNIKPEPKPDVFLYVHAQNYNGKNYGNLSTPMLLENLHLRPNTKANIKLIYDGETNEFKDVEKI